MGNTVLTAADDPLILFEAHYIFEWVRGLLCLLKEGVEDGVAWLFTGLCSHLAVGRLGNELLEFF